MPSIRGTAGRGPPTWPWRDTLRGGAPPSPAGQGRRHESDDVPLHARVRLAPLFALFVSLFSLPPLSPFAGGHRARSFPDFAFSLSFCLFFLIIYFMIGTGHALACVREHSGEHQRLPVTRQGTSRARITQGMSHVARRHIGSRKRERERERNRGGRGEEDDGVAACSDSSAGRRGLRAAHGVQRRQVSVRTCKWQRRYWRAGATGAVASPLLPW